VCLPLLSPVSFAHDSEKGEEKQMGQKMMGKMGQMMKKKAMMVHLSSDDADSASMAMTLATRLHSKLKQVLVFLDVKGVKVGIKNPSPSLEMANSQVRDFIDQAGRVIVCRPCLKKMGVSEDDLLPGIEFSHPDKMSKIFSGFPTIIDY
jgi:predicted peroxiredoxin